VSICAVRMPAWCTQHVLSVAAGAIQVVILPPLVRLAVHGIERCRVVGIAKRRLGRRGVRSRGGSAACRAARRRTTTAVGRAGFRSCGCGCLGCAGGSRAGCITSGAGQSRLLAGDRKKEDGHETDGSTKAFDHLYLQPAGSSGPVFLRYQKPGRFHSPGFGSAFGKLSAYGVMLLTAPCRSKFCMSVRLWGLAPDSARLIR